MQRLLIAIFSLAVILVASSAAFADGVRFTAVLSGDQEVPPVETATTGKAVFVVNGTETEIGFELEVNFGVDTLGTTGAFIHCGPAGANGPAAAFLAEDGPPSVSGKRVTSKGTLSDAKVLSTDCGTNISELVQAMRDGDTYVNVQSIAHANGVVRGQIR
jgi:hypothetical protein